MKPASGASLVDDARGVAKLAIDGVIGVTDIVEHLHATIASVSPPLGPAAARSARGITGFVYRRVRDAVRVVGWSIDASLRPWQGGLRIDLMEREHVRAALNGVLGDQLAAAGNPLAIPSRLTFETDTATSRIVVFAHGLCMHDRQWRRGPGSMDALVRALGWTPVYLHYNTGQPLALNGEELSAHLDALLAGWPKRVARLAIVGHSMGGLVARHAIAHAERESAPWRRRLKSLLFLGSPHRGSAFERAGTRVDLALAMSPYSAPFARLGGARSAGIRALGADSSAMPLPAGVHCVTVAGRLGGEGDGLVSIGSATGLPLPKAQRIVIDGAGHLELMDHPEAVELLSRVLGTTR
jgi:pimeloyl-ACP methyl ester carboxylesterase